ncbi:outer membrane receptor protein involved in Fe transport [Mucilaginibacter frigoritolerans]|uniref:Outer membrane receptor protein involved in Fe transport n=1 Tax=Mucilaginibacter frigoritolerans TaxID=652788 RepID=A0A562UCM3_9SPHI|nr:TonB-dependent receptor [Mucilaginibacter frigoritolerans]TWJ03606.1 outer membrane receptor protein involved in Fe transport [Mucilaginibacter frigoritolerans]
MKLIQVFLFTLFTLLLFNFADAQTAGGKISGSVLDDAKKPLDGATVILFVAKDSAVVSTLLANHDGSFVFQNLTDNTYLIKVTYIGYKNYRSDNVIMSQQKPVNLPAFILQLAGKALNEVAVTAQKSYIQQKIDRTVVNVGALISNTGANALEVLEKTPGVQVDADGNITFKGKSGVLVMIDDKPTYLSAANLATYLKSLPSSALDQIELMDNPPAKYDAAGNAGVINFKTKKNAVRGFNAVVSADYAQGHYGHNDESINLNYRIDKVNLFANVAYNEQRTFRRLEIDRNYFDANGDPTSSLKDISYFRPTEHNTNIKAGMDFYVSPKTTWGIVYTGDISNANDNSPVYSLLYDKNGGLDSTINTQNTSKSKFNSNGINLNYTHKFDSAGRALTFDLDYIHDASGSNQLFVNNTFLPNGSLTNSQTISDDLPASINIYSAKTDYSHPFKGKAKLEAGIKSSYVNTDNAANYFNVIDNVSTIDYNNTNRFLYKENINAAYVNFNKNFGRFSLQTGLRVENTNGNGHQLGNAEKADSSFVNHYTDLFPTAYFSYNLDTAGHNVLVLSYGRRIGRPNYASLNPFTFFVDEFTYFSGNPFLKPQFTDNYKLAYSYRSLFTVALAYNYTTNVQGETIHNSGSIFISTTGNIGMQKTWDLSVNTNFQPTKWWTVNLYAEVYNNTYQGAFYTGYLNQSQYTFSTNGNNQFTLSKTWSAELSGFYNTGGTYGQFVSIPTGMLNAAIQKKILNNKGSIKLNMRDVFHTFSPSGTITNIVGATATYHNFVDTQVATLAFTYSFGKSTNTPPKRETGGADSEQGRAH